MTISAFLTFSKILFAFNQYWRPLAAGCCPLCDGGVPEGRHFLSIAAIILTSP